MNARTGILLPILSYHHYTVFLRVLQEKKLRICSSFPFFDTFQHFDRIRRLQIVHNAAVFLMTSYVFFIQKAVQARQSKNSPG